ncbi:acyltransferase family protein [Mucilaginibacter glaciei]|uniref:Acyltransferase n=1 Tax=Mucilaginibacter glaciei TaxID=2772109 RepID=A0A926NN88_9SPHI|nr:acyltransferase [Mucilaginibacter glaciei]MBD1392328.1 acyltransferase [Mucilaginibacter glaciei]
MNALSATARHVRYKQLDSLRGIAALCVFFSHYLLIFGLSDKIIRPIIASPLGILLNGHAAVMFFFVLSGFVLSLPFVEGHRPLQLTEFYVKRIFRIYPAFVVAILLALVLKTYLYDERGIAAFPVWVKHFWVWHWTTSNYWEIAKTLALIGPNFNADLIDPVIWSLVVEMKMSLILPFFIVLVSRNNLVFNLLFFFIILLLVYNKQAGYLSVFYLGVLCAKYKDQLIAKVQLLSMILITGLVACSLILYNISYEFFVTYGDKAHPFQYFWRDHLTALGSCIVVIVVISRKTITKLLQGRVFKFIGDISYSFYLVHLTLLITICSIISLRAPLSYEYIFLLALVGSVAISYVIYRFVEVPFQKLAIKLVARFKIFSQLNLKS